MRLDQIVTWYQRKIGAYDKQQWEKTVEQKILDGISTVTLKTAKLKTELIDVDLVRGSTFPKAKSKQSLLTVIRLAVVRYLFLPIYTKWWMKQTSPNVFALLLLLYITQMISWAMYTFHVQRLASNPNDENAKESIVSLSDLLIPMGLSFLLSLIHSQIVATNTANGCKTNRRRFSNNGLNTNAPRGTEGRVRRRKKLVKLRSFEHCDVATTQRKPAPTIKKLHSSMEVLTKMYKSVPYEMQSTPITTTTTSAIGNEPEINCAIAEVSSSQVETFHTTSHIVRLPQQHRATTHKPQQLDLKGATATSTPNNDAAISAESNTESNKKRNVNWHSPIHNFAVELETKQLTTVVSPKGSLDSTPSSTSISPQKSVRIDDCVQEFYDELINRTAAAGVATAEDESALPTSSATARRHIGEDDGFESLNGKSSSGEETANSPLPTTSSHTQAMKGQLRLRLNATNMEEQNSSFRRKMPMSSESEDNKRRKRNVQASMPHADVYQTNNTKVKSCTAVATSDETEEEGDDGEIISSPASLVNNSNYNECTTSATEWLGVTTNSEECSYSSELENSDYKKQKHSDEDVYDVDFTPTTILNVHGTSDRISCTLWDQREFKKAQLSVLEISSCIIERVESMTDVKDYIYIGVCFSILLSLIPPFCRLCEAALDTESTSELNFFDVPMLLWEKAAGSLVTILDIAFGKTPWERTVLSISFLQRICLTLILFIIFAVAERTFKQRFLYAKLFSHLTSSRRARKSNLPHFRLHKVRNIKTWLSVRSYLKKRGPQRSVDVIISAAFIVTLLLLAFLSVEWLKDSVHLHTHLNLEALLWSTTIGIFLLRFMTLGNKIHQKYRSVSVLITEQINLYLQIEQKPKKKDELMVSNSVLKLAVDLLKELETPFKISGLSTNPYLFTTIKVVILSALSGVLSEMLGFKLKLHKIKIK